MATIGEMIDLNREGFAQALAEALGLEMTEHEPGTYGADAIAIDKGRYLQIRYHEPDIIRAVSWSSKWVNDRVSHYSRNELPGANISRNKTLQQVAAEIRRRVTDAGASANADNIAKAEESEREAVALAAVAEAYRVVHPGVSVELPTDKQHNEGKLRFYDRETCRSLSARLRPDGRLYIDRIEGLSAEQCRRIVSIVANG